MRFIFLCMILTLVSCNSSNTASNTGLISSKGALKHISFEGGDGSSLVRAVIIKNAKNGYQGIQAQSLYIENRYGIRNLDWRMKSQELKQERNKTFDKITIERIAAQKEAVIYFDISEFYGKL
ncbi:MAG: hypothetical protein ABNH00_13605 [Dokdonia sp.]|nr:hypothetical protein [Cytophagaceae bacterium]